MNSGKPEKTDTAMMDHTKMTFAEMDHFRPSGELVDHLGAINFSAASLNFDQAAIAAINRWLFAKPRIDQLNLSAAAKKNFNDAISAAISAGTYDARVIIHSDMSHRMHHFMPYPAGLRFLAWHRAYLFEMEQLLQSYVPGVTIPYWDWSYEHKIPSWVILPAGVTRGPNTNYTLPNQSDITNNVMNQSDYATFTENLESYHDTVHMWVGGNTMPHPSISPRDPLFWMHHANVDRIWSNWQKLHPGVNPPLSGLDAKMDPWSYTVPGLLDTLNLYYYYSSGSRFEIAHNL